jgi:signal transduction histidine kinase
VVVKASQALSGEIELDKLIEMLMTIAVEHAGAERGLLILFRSDAPRTEAEATIRSGKVEVALRQAPVTKAELPNAVLQYVIRTQESVILDDAAAPTLFSADSYVQQRQPHSVLCLPLVKQAKLVGVLYLENNLTPYVFTPDRIAVLEMLTAQAAISLENAVLYADLQQENANRRHAEEELRRSETFLVEGQRISHTGSWGWNISTGKLVWSEENYRIFGFDPKLGAPSCQCFLDRIHPEDRAMAEKNLDQAIRKRVGFSFEFRIALPDGSSKYLHTVGRPIGKPGTDIEDYIGTTVDITERKLGEEALRNAQADLARVARLMTIGELTASIAHEINQPLAAMVASSNACLRWLAKQRPPLNEVRRATERILREGHRAGDIIRSVRALAGKSAPAMTQLDINDAIREVLTLLRSELHEQDVSLETELSDDLDPIMGDRVQLQQVVLNLLMNGIEAMSTVTQAQRVLSVKSQLDGPGHVRIAVEDAGPGFAPEIMDCMFDAFFTTKASGMGMGLSVCQSIVSAHGGRLWASARSPHGAVFQFTVPIVATRAS